MPCWSDLIDFFNSHPDQILAKRFEYLNNIKNITNRNVIAYYSGWLDIKDSTDTLINDNDKNAFMNAAYGLNRDLGLDLILHSPGGDLAATESIVSYLKGLFKGNVRAIIPQISMSAGTMIAISCKDIIMGRQSSLGPIDPQMGGVPCQSVIDEFKRAVEEVKSTPASLGLWQTIIGQFHPTFLTECESAVKWSEHLAENWLKEVNPNIDFDRFCKTFINHKEKFSHSRHFSYDDCKEAGLNVKLLEEDQNLQDAVLSLHHCYMILINKHHVVKLVENQDGKAYIQQAQSNQA